MVRRLEDAVRAAAAAAGVPAVDATAEVPPSADLGDVAFPTAFRMAPRLGRSPRLIAADLARALGELPEVRRVDVAGAGYVNVFVHRGAWLERARSGPDLGAPDGVHIVEHTSINPNKAAHIGHLRNAALGDSFQRILRFLGRRVEIQNYIDDTGVQVADVALGFIRLRGADLAEVERLARQPRFDYVCWDLYTEVSQWLESDPDGPRARREALHGLEYGEEPWSSIGAAISAAICRRHLETMDRMGVRYDLLACEKTILRLELWESAFRLLRDHEAIRLAEEGKNRGCWVMDTDLAQDGQKVIVRSNGTVTYVGKDIAYQMWQLGLLDRAMRARRFHDYPDGSTAWITTDEAGETDAPPFGNAALVHHVIDARQSYPQKIVQESVARVTSDQDRARTRHFTYEMVSLSPATAAALGFGGSSEEGGAIEVSGRKGIGVKADDLLDALTDRAATEVDRRNPDLPEAERTGLARDIAVGALRFLMVRVTKTQIIAFDLDEALAFEGATGPYLQYAAVRAARILERVGRESRPHSPSPPADLDARLDRLSAQEAGLLWTMMREAATVGAAAGQAARAEDPHVLARWAYEGAQRFNNFYHRYQVAGEADGNARELRGFAVEAFLAGHRTALDLLGIPIPERM